MGEAKQRKLRFEKELKQRDREKRKLMREWSKGNPEEAERKRKEARKKYAKEWAKNNKDKIKVIKVRWISNPKNREKMLIDKRAAEKRRIENMTTDQKKAAYVKRKERMTPEQKEHRRAYVAKHVREKYRRERELDNTRKKRPLRGA